MFNKVSQEEIERQSKMSHKELFILNGKAAAIRSLVFVLLFYIVLEFIFNVRYSAIAMGVLFLMDASFTTFKYKWFNFFRSN
jgi:hypothetical protein